MISVNDVTMNFGARMLFESVNVTFNAGERYGLTGPNGSGKTTFMKILAKELEPMAGHVRLPKRFGILRQDHTAFDRFRVIDVVMMGNPALWEAMSEKETLLGKGDALTDEDGVRLGELEGVIAEEDGYTADSEAQNLLEGLGIPVEYHTQPLSVLQGGDKVRVLLAQALFGKPEALLLDEPTNALDIASIRWLEGFLEDYTGALVVISHDRHFLNEVCTKIADIDYETIIIYNGSYDDMVSTKAEARGSLELANSAKQKKIVQLQEFVQRFRAGSRASQVKSREKQLGREQKALADLKRSNIARPFIRFELKRPSGKQVINVEALTKHFGDVTHRGSVQPLAVPRRSRGSRRSQRHRQDIADAPVARRNPSPTAARSSGATKRRSATCRRTTTSSSRSPSRPPTSGSGSGTRTPTRRTYARSSAASSSPRTSPSSPPKSSPVARPCASCSRA